jgi:hypothetical protein
MIPHPLKCFLAAAAIAFAVPAAAQDRPEGCVLEQWPAFLAPGPQEHNMREKLETDAGEIWAIEFGPLDGEYAKVFLFFLVHEGCERKVFSVGSYGYLNDFARARGEIGEGERVYHLDLYEPEKHTTLEMRYDPPGYEEMRERALNLLR